MPVFSHSRLETFETCPQKYKFRYIDHILKPEEQTVEAFVGSRVHETLHKLYKDLQLTKLTTLDELIEYYAECWKANWNSATKIVQEGYTQKHYFDYGVQCVRNYYAQYSPFNQSQTLRMELQVVFPLDASRRYQIQGYIDRVARRKDGIYEIHDYKTSQRLPSQTVVNTDRQLGLYQIGLATLWPDVEHVELIWHFVGFSTTLCSSRKPDELLQLRESTIRLIERIESEKEFAPRKSRLCDWCEYRSDCPLWRHVEYVDTLTPEQVKTDDGVRIVDEYARAKAEMNVLQARIDKLKEQLVGLAQQQNAAVLQGTSAHVSVRTRQWDSFPGKNDEGRLELEDLISRAGKWNEVSQLDSHALARVLEERSWPKDLLEELGRFATRRSSASVYLSDTDAVPFDEDG